MRPRGKYECTPCFLFLHGFPQNPKHFKHIFAEKNDETFLHSSLMSRKVANDSLLATEHNFEALEF